MSNTVTTRQINFKIAGLALLVLGVILIASIALVSCGVQKTPDPKVQIDAAVAATLSSIPTYTPYPVPTPYPSPVPISLNGLFCEYRFCIGHPADIYLIDEGTTHRPPVAGAYSNGIVFGYNESLFMQLIWRVSDPNFDPQSAMQIIMLEGETFQGSLDAVLIGKFNVFYQPASTITTVLPFGGVAAWQCGGRDFIWKVYAPQDGMAQGLLKQSMEKFRCDER
jgi:hypothetical protein